MTHKCYVTHKGIVRTWAQTACHTASSTEACLPLGRADRSTLRKAAHLGEGVGNVVSLGHALIVGEDQAVHILRHRAQQALQAVLGGAPRVHQLISVDVEDPVCTIPQPKLDALCRTLKDSGLRTWELAGLSGCLLVKVSTCIW